MRSIILRHCQLYINALLSTAYKDGFMKAETCHCYALLINYILCNKVVLDYKIIYFYSCKIFIFVLATKRHVQQCKLQTDMGFTWPLSFNLFRRYCILKEVARRTNFTKLWQICGFDTSKNNRHNWPLKLGKNSFIIV